MIGMLWKRVDYLVERFWKFLEKVKENKGSYFRFYSKEKWIEREKKERERGIKRKNETYEGLYITKNNYN